MYTDWNKHYGQIGKIKHNENLNPFEILKFKKASQN
jgi:hypothetical protein